MAFTTVAAGQVARSTHVQQLIDALTGSRGEPISLSVLSSETEYALAVRNRDPVNGRHFVVLDNLGTTQLFRVDKTATYAHNLQVGQYLKFTTQGQLIEADLSSGEVKNRLFFRSSVGNGVSFVSIRPNGTGTQAGFEAFGGDDVTAQASILIDAVANTYGRIVMQKYGAASALPLVIQLHNGTALVERVRFTTSGNIGINTTAQFGGGVGVIGLANASTVPASNPTAGGVLYAEGGALKWRGSAGTVTTIAAA